MTEHVETLIVGSGLIGVAVASHLAKTSCCIVERGEYRSLAEALSRYEVQADSGLPYWEKTHRAFRSCHDFNETYALAANIFSQFEFISGGSSNRWDGYSVRPHPYVFEHETGSDVHWPFRYSEMEPYYARAEKWLNVCGDYRQDNQSIPQVKIKHGDYYRDVFSRTLGADVFLRNVAKTHINTIPFQGECVGAGTCEICPADSKIRPEMLSPGLDIRYSHLVTNIRFERDRAVAAEITTPDGTKSFRFERIVVACHAVESAKLLYRSELPADVNRPNIGSYFHDHAFAELFVLNDRPFRLRRAPIKTSLEIPSLSGVYNGIDTLVTAEIDRATLAAGGFHRLLDSAQVNSLDRLDIALRSCVHLGITFEMPAHQKRFVDFDGQQPRVKDLNYQGLVNVYDGITDAILAKLNLRGAKVVEERRHYRHMYGLHHLMGTLNIGERLNSVVTPRFILAGTKNVFVAGTSLIPRQGAQNPTLTAVALAHMLGEQLAWA